MIRISEKLRKEPDFISDYFEWRNANDFNYVFSDWYLKQLFERGIAGTKLKFADGKLVN